MGPDLTGREALGPIAEDVERALAALTEEHIVERIWARDPEVWGKGSTEVVDRLGWLTVVDTMAPRALELAAFAADVLAAELDDVVLLGMGGSSLGAEVLRGAFGSAAGFPRLTVLDSTVPGWVRGVRQAIDPTRTLFLVGSKSGTTAEIQAFFQYFWAETEKVVGAAAGSHFVAVTDPATALGATAGAKGFRHVFENPADIGGRFSVLSYFGLVPAALLGLDLERFLVRAMSMTRASNAGAPPLQNPGARLGAILGAAALAGRDQATIYTSPRLAAFGLWAEQLVAESTGKEGRGILPIAGEPFGDSAAYRQDRLFVALRLEGDDNAALDAHLAALEAAGQPVVVLALMDVYDLAGELFRWQMATAVAGHLLGVHPFDQPDVESAKRITKALLAEFRETGLLPELDAGPSLTEALAAKSPSFVAFMAYLPASPRLETEITELRLALLDRHRLATTFGYAPRMLHSTGQYHKGGPATGLYVQLVPAEEGDDLPIPGEPYGFGTLAHAQSLGDARALAEKGRLCLRIAWREGAAEGLLAAL